MQIYNKNCEKPNAGANWMINEVHNMLMLLVNQRAKS